MHAPTFRRDSMDAHYPIDLPAMGTRIAARREECGLPAAALAVAIDASPSLVASYEKGTREATLDKLSRIASMLYCSVAWLTGEDGTQPGPPPATDAYRDAIRIVHEQWRSNVPAPPRRDQGHATRRKSG